MDGGGGRSSIVEKVQALGIIAGLGLGGFLVYELLYTDPCADDGLFGKQGLVGSFNILPFNPACAVKDGLAFFTGLVDVGVGVPVELEPCPAGWTNIGLLCSEPVHCGEGLAFFTEGCSGGNAVGRLDSGGTCPADHPDMVDGLCYRKCPEGTTRTEGMPYTCRKAGAQNEFFSTITGGLF